MPNHVTNIIEAPPHVLESLMRTRTEKELADHAENEKIRRERFEKAGKLESYVEEVLDPEDKIIDFNTVIPLPDDDDPVITATKTEYGGGMVGWSMDGVSPMDLARELWGTKWNAYNQIVDDRTWRIQFDTAWNHPLPVIEALSKLHPDQTIRVQYADENFGNNLEEYLMLDGERDSLVNDYSDEDERMEFAAFVLYDQPYAQLREQWDEESIDSARRAMFAKQLEKERGVDNGYTVMREEGLDVPESIIEQITTREDADNFWHES